MSAFPSLSGQLLLATPDLRDDNFNQSVVAILHHDPTGASGLILNRASLTTIGEVFQQQIPAAAADLPVYVGGPVDGPIMALHQCVSLSERDVLPDVYFSLGRDNLQGILDQSLRPFRVFCGYSGWGPSQLEAEIEAGGWLLTPASSDLVFSENPSLWRDLCDQVGLQIMLADRIALELRPPDPSRN